MLLEWDPPTEDEIVYKVEVSTLGAVSGEQDDAAWLDATPRRWQPAAHDAIDTTTPVRTCQVTGLQPGVRYALRYVCTRRIAAPDAAPLPEFPPSLELVAETPPTVPGAPAPASLASRSKNVLNLRWSPPAETGGRPAARFKVRASPPPARRCRLTSA